MEKIKIYKIIEKTDKDKEVDLLKRCLNTIKEKLGREVVVLKEEVQKPEFGQKEGISVTLGKFDIICYTESLVIINRSTMISDEEVVNIALNYSK